MVKQFKPRAPRLAPEAAPRIAQDLAPHHPPAVAQAEDKPTTLNLRLRASSVAAIQAKATGEKWTFKQVVAHALQAYGVAIAPADLEDRTPRRKG